MPGKLKTAGKDQDKIVPVQVKMPLWLKRKAVERAERLGKTLSDYVKDRLRADVGERPED
jgi:hypothetical protein